MHYNKYHGDTNRNCEILGSMLCMYVTMAACLVCGTDTHENVQ